MSLCVTSVEHGFDLTQAIRIKKLDEHLIMISMYHKSRLNVGTWSMPVFGDARPYERANSVVAILDELGSKAKMFGNLQHKVCGEHINETQAKHNKCETTTNGAQKQEVRHLLRAKCPNVVERNLLSIFLTRTFPKLFDLLWCELTLSDSIYPEEKADKKSFCNVLHTIRLAHAM